MFYSDMIHHPAMVLICFILDKICPSFRSGAVYGARVAREYGG